MFIATALRTSTLADTAREAQRVNAESGDRAVFTLPKFTHKAGASFDQRNSPQGRMRRWAAAYFQSVTLFGLSVGDVWIPCYICGNLFDAWTMDTEHVDNLRGSEIGNLLLSCGKCNRRDKGDHGQVHESVLFRLEALAQGVMYPRGGESILPMWHARERRDVKSGSFVSTPYAG